MVNSLFFSIPLKIPSHEFHEDATLRTQRTGSKHQVFQNFRVQNLVYTQKAHNLPTIRELDNLLCLNTPNIGENLMNAREKSHQPFQKCVINLNLKYNCFTLNNGEKILSWSFGAIYIYISAEYDMSYTRIRQLASPRGS